MGRAGALAWQSVADNGLSVVHPTGKLPMVQFFNSLLAERAGAVDY